jgi:UDP-N-acetylglucosamine--dolichyl-phosphate N-acetylglucosaminephosphotransferase
MATTYLFVPWLIPRLKAQGIVGRDLNKPDKPEVAEMGGIAVVVGFFVGVSVIYAFDGIESVDLFNISLSAVLGAAFVGMMDDLFDMRQRHKAILPFIIALPFGVAVDPHFVLPHVPLIGSVDVNFGILMPIMAAFAVTCAANAANMLEGFNGLGTGLGIIMSVTLIMLCMIHGRLDGVYLLVPLLGTLIAFLYFNKYPAKIFPGDTMMLFVGATLAVAGILSNLHVQTVFIFLPLIVEFFLKMRGKFEAENYCSRAGNAHLVYKGRIESMTHVFMKRFRVDEQELVAIIWGIEIVVCALAVSVDLML